MNKLEKICKTITLNVAIIAGTFILINGIQAISNCFMTYMQF